MRESPAKSVVHSNNLQNRDNPQERFCRVPTDTDSTIYCRLCFRSFSQLGSHLRAAHDLSLLEYLNQFPDAPYRSNQVAIKKSESIKKTVMSRYGVSNISKLKSTQDKRQPRLKATMKAKMASGEFYQSYEKRKRTLLERYNTINVNLIPSASAKRRDTLLRRYGVDSPLKNKEILKQKLTHTFISSPNKVEQIVLDFNIQGLLYTGDGSFWLYLLDLGYKNPDFVLENSKLLIEVYGTYWHRNDNPSTIISAYAKLGYDCLVLQEADLKNRPLYCKDLILAFIENPQRLHVEHICDDIVQTCREL